jgi:hypothetical protein
MDALKLRIALVAVVTVSVALQALAPAAHAAAAAAVASASASVEASTPAQSAALVSQITAQLGRASGIRARFTQTQTRAALKQPLVSSGSLLLARGRGLAHRGTVPGDLFDHRCGRERNQRSGSARRRPQPSWHVRHAWRR